MVIDWLAPWVLPAVPFFALAAMVAFLICVLKGQWKWANICLLWFNVVGGVMGGDHTGDAGQRPP